MSYYQEFIENTNQNLVALTPLGRQPIIGWRMGVNWVIPRVLITRDHWDWASQWAVLDCSSGQVFHNTAGIFGSLEEFEEACKC